jgi:dephospho-CoA kinase
MADIEIHEAKAGWAQEFRGLGRLLRTTLGTRARGIHHIGSTAVPGLAAKDRIDIQVTVGDLGEDEAVGKVLLALGFEKRERVTADHLPPGATDASRWAKRLYKLERPRAVNLHLRVEGRPNATYALLFRDYLRAVPEAAAEYEAVKRRLAAECGDDLVRYTDLKDPECDRVIEKARRWAEQVGWKVPPSDV